MSHPKLGPMIRTKLVKIQGTELTLTYKRAEGRHCQWLYSFDQGKTWGMTHLEAYDASVSNRAYPLLKSSISA